jgi:hypothetical protein
VLAWGEVASAKKPSKSKKRVQAQANDGGACQKPMARCGTGKNALCTDLQTDVNNCGACGKVCPGATSGSGSANCLGGVCGFSCDGGPEFVPCGTKCADLRSDPTNCGLCGYSCPACACQTATCSAGICGSVPNDCPSITGEQCYEMVFGDPGCWTRGPSALSTRAECEAASANCGLGGPCYKWANSSC